MLRPANILGCASSIHLGRRARILGCAPAILAANFSSVRRKQMPARRWRYETPLECAAVAFVGAESASADARRTCLARCRACASVARRGHSATRCHPSIASGERSSPPLARSLPGACSVSRDGRMAGTTLGNRHGENQADRINESVALSLADEVACKMAIARVKIRLGHYSSPLRIYALIEGVRVNSRSLPVVGKIGAA